MGMSFERNDASIVGRNGNNGDGPPGRTRLESSLIDRVALLLEELNEREMASAVARYLAKRKRVKE
jgi:hypothetical protein